MAKERQSNIELCRIFCMIYIVIYHLFIHNREVTGDYSYTIALTTIFSLGVPVFVIISGYFGINRSRIQLASANLQHLFVKALSWC